MALSTYQEYCYFGMHRWDTVSSTTVSHVRNNVSAHGKLYAIYQTVGSVVHNKGLSRHESVIINRLSTDFESVILVSPTLTFCRVTINQLVALVDIHLQSFIYCWTVSICRMSAEDTSLLRVSEICLKPLTIVLLLILSKKSVFTAYCSISSYVCSF